MSALKKIPCCLICNVKLDENLSFDIFNKLLKSNGTLIAEALKRTFHIAELTHESSDCQVVCKKCYIFIEDFCEWELKLNRLKLNLWNLYKSSYLKRNQNLEDIFCGTSTQTTEYDKADLGNEEEKQQFFEEIKESPNTFLQEDAISDSNDEPLRTWHTPETGPISCGVCGIWFKSQNDITTHVAVNHKDNKKRKIEDGELTSNEGHRRKCKYCLVIFKTVRDLKNHLKTHLDETIQYKCRICDRSLYSKTGAQYHAKTHDSKVDSGFNLEKAFEFLIQSSKQSEEQKVITDISDILINAAELSSSEDEVPLSRRKELTPNKPKTGTSEVTSPLLKVVEETQEPKGEVKLVKEDKTSLIKLEMQKDGVNDTLVVKTVIDGIENETSRSKLSRFTNNKLIRKIPKKVGTKIGNKRIPRGERGEVSKSKEMPDMLPPIREAKFKCDICGKMWKTKGELNNHKGTHSDARPYICEICGQGYKHKHALDVHVGMHKGIFQHQCPYCNKAFTQKGALQRHLPIHTGELPYQCELCGKRFVHRTSFSIHTMAHSGVRNIKCPICNLGVLSKSHLRRHMRIHSGEKPYECAICGKTFAERYNLVAHQRVHDPNLSGVTRAPKKKQHTCRLCLTQFPNKPKLEEHMVHQHNKVKDETQQPGLFETRDSYMVPRFVVNESESSSKAESLNSEDDKRFIGTHSSEDNKRMFLASCDTARKLHKVDMRANLDASLVRIIDMPHGWTYPTT